MFKDITRQKFGRLTAVSFHKKNGVVYWLCRCDCGNEKTVIRCCLNRPNVSCGCLHSEIQRARLTKHGMSRTPEYHAWQAMNQRCSNPKNPEYKNYGARGITVCERWQSFDNFLADMGKRPSPDLSLERERNNDGYSSTNCKWATKAEQSNNRRAQHLVEFDGREQTVTRWENELGMKRGRLSNRLFAGWSIERAITTPINSRT